MSHVVCRLSAVLIVKNEESCLEACLASVKDADEIIVVDTGSTDNTVEIARRYTDKVYADYTWNDDYAEARNHALSKSTGDWVLSIDADEELEVGGIAKIRQAITESDAFKSIKINMHSSNGTDQHCYPRIFRKGVQWVGRAHEVPNVVEENRKNINITYGYSPAHQKDPDRMLRLLTKAVEVEGGSRNMYYLAREYWYRKDYAKAIEIWEDYLKVGAWKAERADAWLMLARCYWLTQRGDKARECCANALLINSNFKEACTFIAEMSWPINAIQWSRLSKTADNTDVLFVRASNHIVVLRGTPKVSIVIPTLGREDKLEKLLTLIKERAQYTNYEVIVEHDSFENRQGCPKMLKSGVDKSDGELVMFLGNDCIPENGFLVQAVAAMQELPDGWGMVGLNDGVHDGNKLATHWLASKKLLPHLGGEFFSTEYEHCFCDNELIDRVKELGRYAWAKDARLYHDNAMVKGGEIDDVLKVAYDKARYTRDYNTYLRRKGALSKALVMATESTMLLSLLVCTVSSRVTTGLPHIIQSLQRQIDGSGRTDIELLYVGDNKKRTTGRKRNDMLGLAQGKYVCFLDDDDEVATDFLSEVVAKLTDDVDIVCYRVMCSLNGDPGKPVDYSVSFTDKNYPDRYERVPNHLMVVKRDSAIMAGFKDITYGEDYDYASRLRPLLKTEKRIGKPLYFYNWDKAKTESRPKDLS